MTVTATSIEDLTLSINQEMHVNATLEKTFDALLEQMGPYNEGAEGTPMPMNIEPWPGGRWYRDLGNNNGHLWGHVQAIKRPTLIEISGPLFASYPFLSNVQYRLKEVEGGTLIQFRHLALGFIQDEHRMFLHLRDRRLSGRRHVGLKGRRGADGQRFRQIKARIDTLAGRRTCAARAARIARIDHEHRHGPARREHEVERVVLRKLIAAGAHDAFDVWIGERERRE